MKADLRALVVAAAQGAPVNWGAQPQGGAVPYVVLWQVSGAEGLTMQGRTGLSDARVQVDCYARTPSEVDALARGIVAALNGYRGGALRLVEHVATRDGREGGSNEAERLFRVSLDFTVNWRA